MIWVSNGHTFDFLLKQFFLGYSREKSKPFFLNKRVPPISVYNFKWRAWLWLVEFYTLFRIQVQYQISLYTKKKRGSSINLNIHSSKVFSSDSTVQFLLNCHKKSKTYMNFSFTRKTLMITLSIKPALFFKLKYKQ